MAVSVTEPLNDAFEQTKRVLFTPFKPGKWFVIGFAAWVTTLTSGNVTGNIPTGFPGGGGFPGGKPSEIIDWINSNLTWVIAIAAGVSLLGFVLIGVMTWLRSRFVFIFIDCVVRDRGHIVKPWVQFTALGNSLFMLKMAVVASGYVLSIVVLLIGLLIAWADLSNDRYETPAIIATIFLGVFFVVGGIAYTLITFFIDNVVTPVMYAKSLPAGKAWSAATRLLRDALGPFVLFFLMKILLAIAAGTIGMLLTFLTCCIPAIPYVGTVILLPLFVFPLLYTLKFISRFGPEYDMFAVTKHLCERCRYNLIGLDGAAVCPECGEPIPFEADTPPTSREHDCAHCGYDLIGLDATHCPECGAPTGHQPHPPPPTPPTPPPTTPPPEPPPPGPTGPVDPPG